MLMRPSLTRQAIEAAASIALEPAYNALNSLSLLNAVERLPGLDSWVIQTSRALTREQRHRNRLVFDGLGPALVADRRWPSFEAYLDGLADTEASKLRDRLLQRISRLPAATTEPGQRLARPEAQLLLEDVDAYVARLAQLDPQAPVDSSLHAEAHALLNDPPALQDLVVAHLRELWDTTLAAEWSRKQRALEGMAGWLNKRLVPGPTAAETIRAFIGHDVPPEHSAYLDTVRQVIFVPSAHIGLYINQFYGDETAWVFFGMRNLQLMGLRSEVGRGELLVRLSALADETRLRILQMLTQHDELSAQEIIMQLGLSQSGLSRHLKQLSTAGYVHERRGDGANKHYYVDPYHVERTFHALEHFLSTVEGEPDRREAIAGQPVELRRFLDSLGRIWHWPTKHQDKLPLLEYLASKFEVGRPYSEREVNDLLTAWHTFGDPVTLRRYLVDLGHVHRYRDGSRYWREATPPATEAENGAGS